MHLSSGELAPRIIATLHSSSHLVHGLRFPTAPSSKRAPNLYPGRSDGPHAGSDPTEGTARVHVHTGTKARPVSKAPLSPTKFYSLSLYRLQRAVVLHSRHLRVHHRTVAAHPLLAQQRASLATRLTSLQSLVEAQPCM